MLLAERMLIPERQFFIAVAEQRERDCAVDGGYTHQRIKVMFEKRFETSKSTKNPTLFCV